MKYKGKASLFNFLLLFFETFEQTYLAYVLNTEKIRFKINSTEFTDTFTTFSKIVKSVF